MTKILKTYPYRYHYVSSFIEEGKNSEEIIKILMKEGISGQVASDIYYSVIAYICEEKGKVERIEEEIRLKEEEEIASKTIKGKIVIFFRKIGLDLWTLLSIYGVILSFEQRDISLGLSSGFLFCYYY